MTEPQAQDENPPQPALDDGDSAFEGSLGASITTSLRSSIRNYVYENGRRYHAYREGEYVLPNDEAEQDRLELTHHIYQLLLGGRLCLAPVKKLRRVLDLGTGTGLWAMDFADEHPEAQVIGNDLSPIQPSWVPSNCSFEVDDFEQDWAYVHKFDFIHSREMEGSIRDHDRLFRQCFEFLNPGGYLEMQTIETRPCFADGTEEKGQSINKWIGLLNEAAVKYGKPFQSASTWKEKMEKAGFNVVQEIKQLPLNPWPEDPRKKELGAFNMENVLESLESYSYAPFTRFLGWSREELEVFLATLRRDVRDTSIHVYTHVFLIYGQKPV